MQKLVPRTTSCHVKVITHSPDSLQFTKFVFVRRDAHRSLLQRPFEDPYRVLMPGNMTFVLEINGKQKSCDHLLVYRHMWFTGTYGPAAYWSSVC